MSDGDFEKMYIGSSFYIYTCDVEEAIMDEGNISNHTFKINYNVRLDGDKEFIKDSYEKISKLKIRLRYFKDFSGIC